MVKILIIDDSAFQRKILTGLVKDMGYDVITAENGQEGIEKALLEKPDILITDLLMPVFDGYWLLAECKSRGMEVPVIVVTSDIQNTTMKRCTDSGAVAFLNKTVKKDELQSAIREALTRDEK